MLRFLKSKKKHMNCQVGVFYNFFLNIFTTFIRCSWRCDFMFLASFSFSIFLVLWKLQSKLSIYLSCRFWIHKIIFLSNLNDKVFQKFQENVSNQTRDWKWPSVLMRCDKNCQILGSNPTWCSVEPSDPTSLRGSRWPLGLEIDKNTVINIGLGKFSHWEWPKVGRGAAK